MNQKNTGAGKMAGKKHLAADIKQKKSADGG